jgi:hypothetical protein
MWLPGFLIILVMLVVVGRDTIIDQWITIHASAAVKRTAAELCHVEDHGSTLSSTEQEACYKRWLAALSQPQSTWR